MGFPSFRIAPSAPELPAAWRGAHSDTPDTFEHSIVALHHRGSRPVCQAAPVRRSGRRWRAALPRQTRNGGALTPLVLPNSQLLHPVPGIHVDCTRGKHDAQNEPPAPRPCRESAAPSEPLGEGGASALGNLKFQVLQLRSCQTLPAAGDFSGTFPDHTLCGLLLERLVAGCPLVASATTPVSVTGLLAFHI